MAEYGFKLTSLTEIPSDTPSIVMTLVRGETTITKTLIRYENPPLVGWIDDLENPSALLTPELESGEYYEQIINSFDETDVGDEYTINLSIPEAPTQAFKEAVGIVTEAINVELPQEYASILETALTTKMSAVMSADGKPCVIYDIKWERESATDQNAFDNFYNSIAFVTNHPEKTALIGDGFTIFNKIPGDLDNVGCSISYSIPFYQVSLYGFSLAYIMVTKIDNVSGEKYISADVIGSLLTDITN